jgi:hypothetical protein
VSGYHEQAEARGRLLDQRLADLRDRQDSGDLDVRQAADQRVEALEDHLAALMALREAAESGSTP